MSVVNKLCPWCGRIGPSVLSADGHDNVVTVAGICERCRFDMLGPLVEIPTASKPVTKFCVHGKPLVAGPEGWCDACEGEV